MVYKEGDEVEFKKYGRRNRRYRWVPAEIDKVRRSGMYGELTYNVWLPDSRRIERYVGTKELRYKYSEDLEKRIREHEIELFQEDLRQINLKLARQQRFSRGRQYKRQVTWRQHRAHSNNRNDRVSAIPNHNKPRARSVPPQEWPKILADVARAAFQSRKGKREVRPPEQNADAYHGTEIFEKGLLHNRHSRVYKTERNEQHMDGGLDQGYIIHDASNRFVEKPVPQNPDIFLDNRRRNRKKNVADMNYVVGGKINLNFIIHG